VFHSNGFLSYTELFILRHKKTSDCLNYHGLVSTDPWNKDYNFDFGEKKGLGGLLLTSFHKNYSKVLLRVNNLIKKSKKKRKINIFKK